MRLINTRTKLFEEFYNPPEHYAILSHVWGSEEVTYHEYSQTLSKNKAGYQKISKLCDQAANDGFVYVWIDTCCIDKSSSAELTEAINSMFSWYEAATVCFVLLEDVHISANHTDFQTHFRSSKWFRRGWTLQELLAPRHITFYNAFWLDIGTKAGLKTEIEQETKIFDLYRYREASTAQVFSWAAARQTARLEDGAYSLLGLTKVNMPLLYGEGENAFTRLQLEILARSRDDSIFAWSGGVNDTGFSSTWSSSPVSSMLAGNLRQFETCYDVWLPHGHLTSTWSTCNEGLKASFFAGTATERLYNSEPQLVIFLNCITGAGKPLYVILEILQSIFNEDPTWNETSIKCLRPQHDSLLQECPPLATGPKWSEIVVQPETNRNPATYNPYKPTLRLDLHNFLEHGISIVFHIGGKMDASRYFRSFRVRDDRTAVHYAMSPLYADRMCIGDDVDAREHQAEWNWILAALATGVPFKGLEIFGLLLKSGDILLLTVRSPRVCDYNVFHDAPVYTHLASMSELDEDTHWHPRRAEDFGHVAEVLGKKILRAHQERSYKLVQDIWLSVTTRPVLSILEGLVNCVTVQVTREPMWASSESSGTHSAA